MQRGLQKRVVRNSVTKRAGKAAKSAVKKTIKAVEKPARKAAVNAAKKAAQSAYKAAQVAVKAVSAAVAKVASLIASTMPYSLIVIGAIVLSQRPNVSKTDDTGTEAVKFGLQMADYGERGVKTAVNTGKKAVDKTRKLAKQVERRINKSTYFIVLMVMLSVIFILTAFF